MTAIDLPSWFESTVQPGDLVLTGCSDVTSRLIQLVTVSQVSHAAIVTQHRSLVEAYDYGHTPLEHDEGIYETPFEDFYRRTTLDRVMVRRPIGLNGNKLEAAVRFALDNSPPFPTSGALMINLLILAARPEVQWLLAKLGDVGLSGPIDRMLDGLIDLVADGPERVHCSEITSRLYYGSGLDVRFVQPLLLPHFRRVIAAETVDRRGMVRVDRRLRGKVASLDRHFRRRASRGQLPEVRLDQGPKVAVDTKVTATTEVQKMALKAARQRIREAHRNESDIADLIVPSDFERAEPFDTVGLLLRDRRTGWYRGDIKTERRLG